MNEIAVRAAYREKPGPTATKLKCRLPGDTQHKTAELSHNNSSWTSHCFHQNQAVPTNSGGQYTPQKESPAALTGPPVPPVEPPRVRVRLPRPSRRRHCRRFRVPPAGSRRRRSVRRGHRLVVRGGPACRGRRRERVCRWLLLGGRLLLLHVGFQAALS